MADEDYKRKLTAILSADVKGYSLLMADNEIATIETITSYREIMKSLIERYQGRVVDSPGDNLLAEFQSVVDAVQCAVNIQNELKLKNDELPSERRMEFRIGVNLGDIVQDGARIYGDGVNIASRVEGLADPGGVAISGTAFDNVRNKLDYGFQYYGEHTVKNITNPVRIYKVLMEPEYAGKVIGEKRFLGWLSRKFAIAAILVLAILAGGSISYYIYLHQTGRIEPAVVENMAYPLPEKPSIAVLPFDNMSGDPQQEYFCDGLTEEIISSLSKTDQLFVIARNSTFTYKGKPVKIKQVSEELGVRYVLEGSIRKTEDRVRITAQLIDAVAGHHLWSERYDRDLKDIFALQDEITIKIVTALQIQLTVGEQARMWWGKRTGNLDLLLKRMEALSLWRKGSSESHMRFGQVARELIDMAPEDSVGYRCLSWHYWYLAGTGKSPRESMAKAFELAQKALSLDESDSQSHALLGSIYVRMRQYEKAIDAGERSAEIDPNGAMVHALLGQNLNYAGRPDEGIVYLKKAIRLNPLPAYWYYSHLGLCYLQKGQYENALTELKKALQRAPEAPSSYYRLSIAYTLLGREEEARAAAAKSLELRPSISVSKASKRWPYKNKAFLKIILDAMRKAGFPE